MVTAKKATASKTTAPAAVSPATPVAAAAPKVAAKAAAPVVRRKAATPKAAAKPTVATKPKAAAKPKVAKPVKPKKPKLVRDSFTIPKAEYLVLADLKARANKLASPAKKSELLRAGIKALAAMSDAALLAALKAVHAIKTGRPAKD